MELGLRDRGVLVMASSSGIGRAVAREFARNDARVMLFARREALLEEAAAEILAVTGQRPAFCIGDLTRPEDVRHVVRETQRRFGTVWALVNNSGGPPPGPFERFDDEAWQAAFDLTLRSYVRSIREVVPIMKEAGGGRIVNLTSSSSRQALDDLILSNTFRMAVVGLTKTLARELGPSHILANVVGPGRMDTARVRELDHCRAERGGLTAEDVRRSTEQRIPLQRYGDPDELARLVVFLCSAANSYVTGQTLLADGGMTGAY